MRPDCTTVPVSRGRAFNADLVRMEFSDGRPPVMLKTFARKGLFARHVIGRFLVRREHAMLARLRHVRGICRTVSDDLDDGLLLEWIDGRPLDACGNGSLPRETAGELSDIVRAMHEAEVVHLDLGHRGNILVAGGHPILIDFQSAVCTRYMLPPVKRFLRHVDELAVMKWKERIFPDSVTPDERRMLRTRRRLSRLWPFHHWIRMPR